MTFINSATSELVAASNNTWRTMPSLPGNSSTQIASGFSNNRWQHINAGGFLIAVNGEDAPRSYNGTTVASLVFSGDLLTDGPENVDCIHSYKNRIYMFNSSTNEFYYGGTNAIQGDFTKFSLNSVSKTGGNITTIKTLSFDSGSGLNDKIVFFLSTGETIIYNGSNPGDANNFAIEGIFFIPPPIGIRCAVEFLGDIRVITEADTISLMEYIRLEGRELRLSKLSGAVKSEVADHRSKFGWQAIWYNAGDLIVYNVPNVNATSYVQYVTNTSTGASSKITGFNGQCFAIWNNELYFGGVGAVYKAFDGLSDDGQPIDLIAQQAFTTINIPQDKRFKAVEFLISSDGTLNLSINVAYNYGQSFVSSSVVSNVAGTQWGDPWGSPWAGASGVRLLRSGLRGVGLAVAAKINIKVQNQMPQWYQTSYVYEPVVAR